MVAMTQLAKFFTRKTRAAKEGLHSLLTMNNEEELSFETEVAQAAALSAHSPLTFLRRLDCSKTFSRQVSQAARRIVFSHSLEQAQGFFLFPFLSIHVFFSFYFLGLPEPPFDLSAILN